MKQIWKGVKGVILILLIVVFGFLIYTNFLTNQQMLEAERQASATPEPVVTPTPTPTPTPDIQETNDIVLTVLGDIVVHTGLNAEAKQPDGTYDYTPIMEGVKADVEAADYAICTMETALAGTGEYTGYPLFKSPDGLATSLKNLGIDMVNTASNHCMDGMKAGLVRTIDVLEQNGLDHIGTYRSQEERDANNGIVVKDINGISIAFVSYTYGTNGISVSGFNYAVNLLYTDYLNTLANIDYDALKADMAAARALNTDLIVCQMHWGVEYETTPVAYQTELADFLFKEGADLVLGGHVHVPEPMELRHVVDNEGNEKTGFIAYCMGNLISCQNDEYTNLTAALNITIAKETQSGKTYIKHVEYKPMFMVDLQDFSLTSDWQYKLFDLHKTIADYDAGTTGVINDKLYQAMKKGVTDLQKILGPEFDSANGGIDVLTWQQD